MVDLDPEKWHFIKWLSYQEDKKKLTFIAEQAS